MTVKEFPGLRERYVEFVLPCGLTVRVLPKPEFEKTYAVVAVNFGSVDTEFEYDGKHCQTPPGVAHYLEHKMFDLPEGNAMQQFNSLGGNPNAFTGYDITAYYVQAAEQAEENLRLLLHMVLTPFFTEESVEKERGIIAEEINMYADSADSQVYERLFAVMYPEHAVRFPIAGTVRSIEEITADTLQLCYDAFYRPSNMILCVEGKLSPQTVLAVAQQATAGLGGACGQLVRHAGHVLQCQRTEYVMDVAMPTFSIGVCLPELVPGDATTELAAELACELVAGEASRCYQSMYEQGMIDPSFYIGFESIRSLALLSFGGDSERIEEVASAVFSEAERIRKEGIDRTEFERLKKSLIGRRMRELDSFPGTCNRICGYFFEGLEYLDFPNVFAQISEEDVKQVLSYFVRERACISVICPREEEEST